MTRKAKAPAPPAPLAIVYRAPGDLKPDPRNARTHSPEQLGQLRASIREFGFTNPVLLRPDGMIGAGHGRVEAAKAEGLAEIPTVTIEGLSDDQWRAYVLADNRIPLNAGWDADLLAVELAALGALDVDLTAFGFDQSELTALGDLDVQDGFAGEVTFADSKNTGISIGPYRVKITEAEFNAWQDAIRETVGFEPETIRAEIKRRLGVG